MTPTPTDFPQHLLPPQRGAGSEFWQAAAQGRLVVPWCGSCRQAFWYPRAHCPACGAGAPEWREASGRGTLHSFTVVRQSGDPWFKARVPYVVAIVELAEGPRLMSNLVDCAPERVRIGMPVQVAFAGMGEGRALPVFRPAE